MAFGERVMLKMKIKQHLGGNTYYVICPNCNYQIHFYFFTPPFCTNCGRSLPDVKELYEDITLRKKHHLLGKFNV